MVQSAVTDEELGEITDLYNVASCLTQTMIDLDVSLKAVFRGHGGLRAFWNRATADYNKWLDEVDHQYYVTLNQFKRIVNEHKAELVKLIMKELDGDEHFCDLDDSDPYLPRKA